MTFPKKRFEFPKDIENVLIDNDVVPMIDILVIDKFHDKVTNVLETKEYKLTEHAKGSKIDQYLIPCISIESINDNHNLTSNGFLK